MNSSAIKYAYAIFQAATPVIRIHGIGGKRWKRNVATGSRIGPWLEAEYEILDKAMWEARNPCLYLVASKDGLIKYVGISRNRLKDRWRISPAYDAKTMARLPNNQLFHSQCWKYIELESKQTDIGAYEIRCINGASLLNLLEKLGPPLNAFTVLRGDDEGIVAGVERWMCNNKSPELVSWNIAMTGK